jgi:hypothetical protein
MIRSRFKTTYFNINSCPLRAIIAWARRKGTFVCEQSQDLYLKMALFDREYVLIVMI